jgi:hypothetical protein
MHEPRLEKQDEQTVAFIDKKTLIPDPFTRF